MKALILPNPYQNALSIEVAGLTMREGILAHDPDAQCRNHSDIRWRRWFP